MTHLLRQIPLIARDDSGVAMVEFAFVLPVLLVLVLAVADFGRAFSYWLDATHLANMGARWAAVNRDFSTDPGCAGVPANALRSYIRCGAMSDELRANVVVGICTRDLPPVGTPGVGDAVEVKVRWSNFPFKFIRVLRLIDNVDIEGKATMRLEAKPPASYPACAP
jgi:hypothetical protein